MNKEELAKEIHDGLSQILTAASINLGIVGKYLDHLDPEKKELFEEAYALVNQAVNESRKITQNLSG